MSAHEAALHLRADEPAAIGHFPGNPIIPGAVLLREVLRIVAPDGEAMCCEIRAARFFKPVRPGDSLTIRWNTPGEGEISFTCAGGVTEERVLSGTIRVRTR
jgi:3-hydroxymyristoyl/3-hydroxydecanoyl-(acyl carrier protein) dehydratase